MFLRKAVTITRKTKNLLAGIETAMLSAVYSLLFSVKYDNFLPQLYRGRNHQSKLNSDRAGCVKEEVVQPCKAVVDKVYQVNGSQSSKVVEPQSQVAHHSFMDRVVTGAEHQMAKVAFLFINFFNFSISFSASIVKRFSLVDQKVVHHYYSSIVVCVTVTCLLTI